MKTCTFIFWIYLLVLFPNGLFSKSLTNNEQYSSDGKNSNANSEIDIGSPDVALHDSFRARHKYKSNGRQTRVYRSDNENVKEQESKTPQCAVMYKDNEPVGILQPFKESYKFLPINGDPTLVDLNPIPVKRKTFMDVLYPNKMNDDYNEEAVENTNQFADDRYPSIFAKFKIDSRLDKNLNPDLNMKRSMYKRDDDKPAISDEQVSSLKNTLSKMKSDNSAVVEEELKNILDDMGLIEDYDDSKEEAKREVEEDENMEQGANKINLIKEVHNETTRNKRSDGNSTVETDHNSTLSTSTTVAAASSEANDTSTAASSIASTPAITPASASAVPLPAKAKFEEDHTVDIESVDLFKDNDAKVNDDSEKEDLEVSTEIELEDSRKKRQFEEEKIDESNASEKRDAKDDLPDIHINSSSLVKTSELNDYEKRVEREIRDRIQKLKDEVKEEIKSLKVSPRIQTEESDSRRKKRQVVNTLVEEETPNIDPNLNDENPQKVHHVRRKRSLISDLSVSNEFVNNGTRQTPDFSGKLNDEYQIIDESKNGLRFVINFGGTNSKIKSEIKDDVAQNNKVTEKDIHNVPVKTTNAINSTITIDGNERIMNIKPNTALFSNKINSIIKAVNTEYANISLSTGNFVTRNDSCKHSRNSVCYRCHKSKQYPRKINQRLSLITFRMKSGDKVKRKTFISEPKNSVDRKEGVLKIPIIIDQKNFLQNNCNNHTKENNCTSCQMYSNGDINQINVKNISCNLNKTNTNERLGKPLIPVKDNKDEDKTFALKRFQLHDNITEVRKNRRRKGFIGISPILENVTNIFDHHQSRGLKEYDEDMKTGVELYDDVKILEDIDNLGKMKSIADKNAFLEEASDIANNERYQSRNLKQLNEDSINYNVEGKRHIRVKRFVDSGKDEYNSDQIMDRRKRHSRKESDENSGQYDDSEFNEDVVNENQSYYDQPYANDNDDMFTSKVKSNCNCDKSGSGCKCGTQRTDLSVPNVKEDYSDYVDGPKRVLEKKAASHCNCDKNGKHCKCQTFDEGAHYSDYSDEHQAVEGKASDVEDDIVSDEVQDEAVQRVPRRPRQNRENDRQSWKQSDDLSEDYYDNYENEGGKTMKREIKPRKSPNENEEFHNGEYFVDLHPDVYRLTPVENSRKKRNTFKDLVAIHGGGPVVNHLVAIKQRSMLPHLRIRRRVQNEDNSEPRQLIDMSEEDLFGALPQSFAGELARYKRVKRGEIKK